jgi:hypothetical protein
MKLKEMSLFEAAERLQIDIEETTKGLRLTFGPDDEKAGEVVTLEDAEEMISSHKESWKFLKSSLSDKGESVKSFYYNVISEWANIAAFLKSATTEDSEES